MLLLVPVNGVPEAAPAQSPGGSYFCHLSVWRCLKPIFILRDETVQGNYWGLQFAALLLPLLLDQVNHTVLRQLLAMNLL